GAGRASRHQRSRAGASSWLPGPRPKITPPASVMAVHRMFSQISRQKPLSQVLRVANCSKEKSMVTSCRRRRSVHAFFAEALGHTVRADHEDQADQPLEEADGGGEAQLTLLDARGVDEGVEDFADLAVHGVQQQEHVLEAQFEEVPDG